jgi:hypothetical protein
MGWLCARYKESCYWYEFLYLEVRMVSLFVVFWTTAGHLNKLAISTNEVYNWTTGEMLEGVEPGMTCIEDSYAERRNGTQATECGTPLSPSAGAVIVSILTVMMAVAQFKLKPFEESEEEASGGWRHSPNRQVRPNPTAFSVIYLSIADAAYPPLMPSLARTNVLPTRYGGHRLRSPTLASWC